MLDADILYNKKTISQYNITIHNIISSQFLVVVLQTHLPWSCWQSMRGSKLGVLLGSTWKVLLPISYRCWSIINRYVCFGRTTMIGQLPKLVTGRLLSICSRYSLSFYCSLSLWQCIQSMQTQCICSSILIT